MLKKLEVPVENLRQVCNGEQFSFQTTAEVSPLDGIIGQERAVRAMEFGLSVKSSGYNIYMSGVNGTGKTTYARSLITKIAATQQSPGDWCYVHNFMEPTKPLALFLPAGKGLQLQKGLAELLRDLWVEIPKALNSDDFKEQKQALINNLQKEKAGVFAGLERMAAEAGLMVKQTGSGLVTIPVKEGKSLSQEEIAGLTPEELQVYEERSQQLQKLLEDMISKLKIREKQVQKDIQELEKQLAVYVIDPYFRNLLNDYQDLDHVRQYLLKMLQDLLDNLSSFKLNEDEGKEDLLPAPEVFTRYQVNLLVNNCETCGAPVIVETNPTYYNLFGLLEYQNQMGAMVTDFTMIKPGSIHRANGGYLLIQAKDLVSNPLSWEALKRALKNQEIRIENSGDQSKTHPVSALKPEPIELNLKIILIGSPVIYHWLYNNDEDFQKYFKIMADFDNEMTRNDDHMYKYAAFISSLAQKEKLLHFDRSAVARVVEYGSRLVENQEKLSTRFNEVMEILYEANAWAEQAGSGIVTGEHVIKAIREKIYRANRVEEKLTEMISGGRLMVETEGQVIGQVNGLAVYRTGNHAFGKPSRITARVFTGEKGIVNIEREVELSGKIHDKGVLVLSGYLGGKYAQDKHLALSASLCFEQMYEGVDGDSASGTELYALLSALAEAPLKQNLAVTGSVNQRGEIQPIGGVNEKIEGFFAVCKKKGLTGDQGVLIPHQNVKDLMLNEEVVEAVRQGQFHVYQVHSVNEGIELLTGVPAGELLPDGSFTPNSIHDRVNRRLSLWADFLERRESKRQIQPPA